ncbi:hypothetical protein KY285_028630 [Solanum tuberosum]|nr:hypothetical protein KY284_028574 [Solanum tuberosum]KAH0667424.1 hypothetical protein KY285_028630 [Solanum tuberosum]
METRRSKGLCFNCDEKYSYGHVCKKKRQLFYMEVEEGEREPKEIEDDIMVDPAEFLTMIGQGLETDNERAILPHVFVHAMNGSHDFKTMRVTVSVKGKAVHVLIDTSSTHNFLDLNTTKNLGCVMTTISHFAVSVADGKKIQSNYVCKKLAQNMIKIHADKERTEREYAVGDWVYVKLQPYKQVSLKAHTFQKLAAMFFGPFQIIARVGSVAYTLDFPPNAKVHPTFHISQLKKKLGDHTASVVLPLVRSDDGHVLLAPEAILDRRLIKRHGKPLTQLLIKWFNTVEEDSTWEDYQSFIQQFPSFHP